jgi:4-amino-4-deoxy-L-arabinose transferase-like glycosyltransferase
VSGDSTSRSGGLQSADLDERRPGGRRSLSVLILLTACMLALFLATNLPWQLDDYDQAKQAYTSFEMVQEGHWLFQHTPHERIATKPPLVGWISAGLFEVTRSWDLAWRLPSILAALALAFLLFRAGNVYGPSGGVIAMGAFAFNLLTPRLASLVRTDMPLALVVFALGALFWQKIREQNPWTLRDQLWLFLLLTAGMLIKGPIVYAFLLPGLAVAAVYDRRKSRSDGFPAVNLKDEGRPDRHSLSPETAGDPESFRGRSSRAAWSGWWPWLASLGVFLLWVIGGCWLVPQFYEQVVLREFLGRFGETIHRPQPIYFYLPHLLHKFAPWSVLLLVLAFVDWRGRRWKFGSIRPETLWLIGWAVGGLVVMSVVPSKRVDRIYSVIPPLCLLLAGQVRGRWPKWVGATLAVAIVYSASYAGYKVRTGYREHRDALVQFGKEVRERAAQSHWRYEVLEASDEGLLLYLQKLHFVRPDAAVEQWLRGDIDALVGRTDKPLPKVTEPSGTALSPDLKSDRREGGPNYVLITH